VGFGLGSLIFGELLRFGFGTALALFTVFELSAALLSFALFRSEVPISTTPAPEVAQYGQGTR